MNRSIYLRSLLVIVLFATLVFTPWTVTAQDSSDPADPIVSPDVKAAPRIWFPYVPPIGSTDNLKGRVANVTYDQYRVAVYIYTQGWYNKPYWKTPTTVIDKLGRWTTDITTGQGDVRARKICAFLIPSDYKPPRRAGETTLPAVLYAKSVVERCVTRKQ